MNLFCEISLTKYCCIQGETEQSHQTVHLITEFYIAKYIMKEQSNMWNLWMTAGIFHSQQFCFYCSVFSSMSAAHVGSLGFFDIMGSACNAHDKAWLIRVGADSKERKVNL